MLNKNNFENSIMGNRWSSFFLILYDIFVVNVSFFAALFFRFDMVYSSIPQRYLNAYTKFSLIYTVFCIVIFYFFNMYNSVWKFAGVKELARIFAATFISSIFHIIVMNTFIQRMPISYYIFGITFQFLLLGLVRFFYKILTFERDRRTRVPSMELKRVMLIGAGSAGKMILDDAKRSNIVDICCIIDDNIKLKNKLIGDVPVAGGRDDILDAAKKYRIEQIIFTIPSIPNKDKRDILNICQETGCEIKVLPGIYQLISGEVKIANLHDVKIEDLLGRDPIKILNPEDFAYIENKTILVTGGGGTIGSELCRQIAQKHPKKLIIFDIYENTTYEIQQELLKKHPELDLLVLIGSVRDKLKIDEVFEKYKPNIVYHAAAHKHVPLMEVSPTEAVKNNVIGTYNVVHAALMNKTDRFILISTDKAVNPTNVMGASKRICEMIIQSMDKISKSNEADKLPNLYELTIPHNYYENQKDRFVSYDDKRFITEFVAVRFGNVLGSNGSVIPLFKKQISEGGPVTVTHPDIIRYFMTISEAVSLVLQAGNFAKGGEIFVLDMGDPVKIDTLARNLIKLSGYKPDIDIKIEYSGLRPGEKLYEEKLMDEEGLQSTPNELIHIGHPIEFDIEEFFENLKKLAKVSISNSDDIVEVIASIVSTYHSPEEDFENEKAKFYELYNKANGNLL